MTLGHRMSNLPIAAFCGQSAALNTGAGRAAAMGRAAHQRFSGKGEVPYLTDEEREKVDALRRPTPITIPLGTGVQAELRYEDAEIELTVALDANGNHVAEDSPEAISVGHLDMAWFLDIPEHGKVAIVGDIKRSEFTEEDGPESLQLQAYAFAWASKCDAEFFLTAIWGATEGRWSFGELVDLTDFDAVARWKRVKAAILNVGGEYNTGPHCRRCYSRWQCPAHLLPPELAETSLAPLTSGQALTPETALRLKVLCDRVESTLKVAKDSLKDYAIQHGGIPDGAGKLWKPVMCKGQTLLDRAALEAKLGDLEPFTKQGKPYPQMKWVNE